MLHIHIKIKRSMHDVHTCWVNCKYTTIKPDADPVHWRMYASLRDNDLKYSFVHLSQILFQYVYYHFYFVKPQGTPQISRVFHDNEVHESASSKRSQTRRLWVLIEVFLPGKRQVCCVVRFWFHNLGLLYGNTVYRDLGLQITMVEWDMWNG